MQNKQLGYKIARVHPSYFIQNVLEVIWQNTLPPPPQYTLCLKRDA
jgi:hypothetical protein